MRRHLRTPGSNDIEHVAATYVINRQGKLSDLFTTQPSYAAIGQMGQLLARDAAALLPGASARRRGTLLR